MPRLAIKNLLLPIIILVILLLLALFFKDQIVTLWNSALNLFKQPEEEKPSEEEVTFAQSIYVDSGDPPVSVIYKFFRYFNTNYIFKNDAMTISGNTYQLSPNKEVYNVFVFKFNQDVSDNQIKCAILGSYYAQNPSQNCPTESQYGGLFDWTSAVTNYRVPYTFSVDTDSVISYDNDCFNPAFLDSGVNNYPPDYRYTGEDCGWFLTLQNKCRAGDYCKTINNMCCPYPYLYYDQNLGKCYIKNTLDGLYKTKDGLLISQKSNYPANKRIKIRVAWYYEMNGNVKSVWPLITVCGE